MITRKEDWREHLYGFFESRKDRPVEWGQNDCCMFAMDAFHAMTGHDIGAKFRGRYKDRESGAQTLRDYTGEGLLKTLEAVADEMGSAEVQGVSFGDVAVVRVVNLDQEAARLFGGMTLGVGCGDNMVMIPGKSGTEIIEYPRVLKAWRPNDVKAYNWEVVMGCDVMTEGCESCPSFWEARENEGKPGHRYEHGYGIRLIYEKLTDPMVTAPSALFNVAFGSDLFHGDVSLDYIKRVFAVMNLTPYHTYEVATKRAERLAELAPELVWTDNIRVGVAIEKEEYKYRIDLLKQVPSPHRFISFIPLLGPMGAMDLTGIEFVGLSPELWGLKREFDPAWGHEIAEQCAEQNVIMSGKYYLYHDLQGT